MPESNGYEATSERVSEDEYQASEGDYLIYLFHLATYDFARPFLQGRRVLDFGCGTGYGTHRVALGCASIVGVDVSGEAISFAGRRYRADNLSFHEIVPVEEAPLPFADGSFDVVLSFQVIEHAPDALLYLAEAKRVLTEDGLLILATPDRTTRLLRRQRPWNRYHLTEYSPDELAVLIGREFGGVDLNGMGAAPEIIGRELARSRRVRWLTLPFTFPGAPERWRQAGLRAMKATRARLHKESDLTRRPGAPEGAAGGAGDIPVGAKYSYDATAVSIAPDIAPSVNIVAVARVRRP
jgi:SAM-dependent methyltransferase